MGTSSLQERVDRLLQASGLDAKNLGLLCGLSSSHVGQITRGAVASPGMKTLGAIAETTGVSPAWLAFGEGDAPSDEEIRAAVDTARARARAAEDPAEESPDLAVDPRPSQAA